MSNILEFPANVSPNGSEIWDWAGRIGNEVQRLARLRDLRDRVYSANNECGSCYKWMKSRECPREKNVNGYSRGPSMKDRICGQFVMGESSKRHIENLESEIAALTAKQETP